MILPYHFKSFPFRLLFSVAALNAIGILVIHSATNSDMAVVGRQLTGAAIGAVAMLILCLIPYQLILRHAVPVFAACCGMLLLVNVYGRIVGGARRWIVVPGIGQLQPSEFAKIGIVVFFAWFLDRNRENINKPQFLAVFAGLAAIPVFLILSEPDLSTTIVVTVCILSLLYVAEISYKWIGAAVAVVIPFAAGFFVLLRHNMIPFLQEYQARRILAWIDRGSGYTDANLQQNNSIMAIGSGQLFGKGLNNNTLASVKNGNFLSEEQTDFIFAVIGEELGFIGCIIVIALYAAVVYECFYLAGKAKDLAGRLICTGLGMLIAFQGFSNIAVATGIFPNTGLTLPFISYGVSSLLSFYCGVGMVLNVGLQRTDPEVRDDRIVPEMSQRQRKERG